MDSKRPLESRTIWFNLLVTVVAAMLGVLEVNFHLLQDRMSPVAYLIGLAIVTGINVFLRCITKLPVSLKGAPSE